MEDLGINKALHLQITKLPSMTIILVNKAGTLRLAALLKYIHLVIMMLHLNIMNMMIVLTLG